MSAQLDVLVADVSGFQPGDISGLAGLGFGAVIVKYAEGTGTPNPVMHEQAASAVGAGMLVFGGYNFSLPGDGRAQCDTLLAAFGADPVQRAVLDAEVDGLDRDLVLAFGRRAQEWNPNIRPVLYGSTSFIARNYAGDSEIAGLFDLWVAAYTVGYREITVPATAPPSSPSPFPDYIGWQFTSSYPAPWGHIDASVFDSSAIAGNPGAPLPPVPAGRPILRLATPHMTGPWVANLQNVLIELGFDVGASGADSDFGGVTNDAVVAYQQSRGLEADGIVGPVTWGQIDADYAALHAPPAPAPEPAPVPVPVPDPQPGPAPQPVPEPVPVPVPEPAPAPVPAPAPELTLDDVVGALRATAGRRRWSRARAELERRLGSS